jgi:RES domain-containing protein
MLVYRIVHKSHSSALYAPGIAGRWNSAGRKVVYAAESISLAFMENMIRRAGHGFNNLYTTMVIEVPDRIGITVISAGSLPPGWRNYHDYTLCQSIGDAWFENGASAILKVPSAVLPQENNFVINSTHRDFSKLKLVGNIPILPDERIEDILKKYKPK